MKKKDFDCVEMMHTAAQKLQAEIEGMTVEEEVAFWHARSEELRREEVAVRRRERKAA